MLYLTIVCIAQCAAFAAVIVYVLIDRKVEREGERNERRAFADRIQHPERVQPLHSGDRKPAPKPHPNLAKIGTYATRDDG